MLELFYSILFIIFHSFFFFFFNRGRGKTAAKWGESANDHLIFLFLLKKKLCGGRLERKIFGGSDSQKKKNIFVRRETM